MCIWCGPLKIRQVKKNHMRLLLVILELDSNGGATAPVLFTYGDVYKLR